ncbi:MAG TPA: serine/threonine-protein kinase, partial [Planctomycetota bacterium]|nr:serine/threonine-protein kinase [Planctomycetota bacterium]
MHRGLASADALKECIRLQAERAGAGRAAPLAELIVERGLLSAATLETALRDFEAGLARCEGCGAWFHPLTQPGSDSARCRRCSASGSAAARARAEKAEVGEITGAFQMARASGRAAAVAAPATPAVGVRPGTGGYPGAGSGSGAVKNPSGGHRIRGVPLAEPKPAAPAPAPAPVPVPVPEKTASEHAPEPPHHPGVGAVPEYRERFGEYEILEVVAKGGMGIVFKAQHRQLKRIVALKVLREARRSSDDHVKRFKREAQSVAKLQHEHIVRVHEFGVENGEYFFTMDFIEGESFEKFLERPDRDLRKGIEHVRDIARALHFAHENGIIHRDIKPANILVDAGGRAQITDFGLARNVDHATALTQEGELLGTPLYMSPEQVRGRVKDVDARSDVYGLGVILYQHLAGQLPFLAQTMVELQWKVVNDEPLSVRHLNPAVDGALETITLKCLEKARD